MAFSLKLNSFQFQVYSIILEYASNSGEEKSNNKPSQYIFQNNAISLYQYKLNPKCTYG